MGGLLQMLLSRKNRDDYEQAQMANLEAVTKLHELDYGIKKAEVDRMNAERKFLKEALGMFTPQALEERPNVAGAVLPWSQAQEGPRAGLVNAPGAAPNIPPQQLIDLLVSAKAMFPGAGDISQNIAPLLQAREKLGWMEMAKGLLAPEGGMAGPAGPAAGMEKGAPPIPTGPVNLQPGAPRNRLAGIIQQAGQGDPNAAAVLAGLKMGGMDLTDVAKMTQLSIKPRELIDEKTGKTYTSAFNERTGDFLRDKEGNPVNLATTKIPELEKIEITREDGSKQVTFIPRVSLTGGASLVTGPPETTLKEVTGETGEKGLIRIPVIGKPGEVFPTAPPETRLEPVELPGGGKKMVRVPVVGKPGEEMAVSPEQGKLPDQAGRIQLAQMGAQNVKDLAKLMFKPDGTVDRAKIFSSQLPGGGLGMGREIRSKMRSAIEAPIRAATGAVVNEQELNNYMNIYSPSVLDSDELIRDKLTRLYEFNLGFMKKVDPTGAITSRVGEKLVLPGEKKAEPKVELPETARKSLKEGINTTFKNGQVWTLRNGKPVRVK